MVGELTISDLLHELLNQILIVHLRDRVPPEERHEK